MKWISIHGESNGVDDESRAYLDQTLGVFRDEMRQGFATSGADVGSLREELTSLRQEFEDLRHDIRGIAEGVISLSERVDRLGLDIGVRAEMSERFTATHAVVRACFRDVSETWPTCARSFSLPEPARP